MHEAIYKKCESRFPRLAININYLQDRGVQFVAELQPQLCVLQPRHDVLFKLIPNVGTCNSTFPVPKRKASFMMTAPLLRLELTGSDAPTRE